MGSHLKKAKWRQGPDKLQKWLKWWAWPFPFEASMLSCLWHWSTHQINDVFLLAVPLKQLKTINTSSKLNAQRISLLLLLDLFLACPVTQAVSPRLSLPSPAARPKHRTTEWSMSPFGLSYCSASQISHAHHIWAWMAFSCWLNLWALWLGGKLHAATCQTPLQVFWCYVSSWLVLHIISLL